MNFPRPEVFGNYMLKDFGDIVLPADLAWWPIQPGWWVLLAALLLAASIYSYRRYRHWQRNAYLPKKDNQGRSMLIWELIEALIKSLPWQYCKTKDHCGI